MPTDPFVLCLQALLFKPAGPFTLTTTGPLFYCFYVLYCLSLAHDMLSFAIPKYSLTFGAIQIPLLPVKNR